MKEIQLTRINKFLSEAGYCSRRAADKLIDQGRVTINGKVPEMGTKISSSDEVRVDGKLINEPKENPVYLAFNKPIGIVCTTDTKVEKDNIDQAKAALKKATPRLPGTFSINIVEIKK